MFTNGIIVNGLSSFSDMVTFNNGITVTGTAPINITSTAGINLIGDVNASGTTTLNNLNVTGTSTLSDLNVTGSTTLTGATNLIGNVNMTSNAIFAGMTNTTLPTLLGNANVTGNTVLTGNLNGVSTITSNITKTNTLGVSHRNNPVNLDITKTIISVQSNRVYNFIPGYDGQILIFNVLAFAAIFNTGNNIQVFSFNSTYVYQFILGLGYWVLVSKSTAT